jgi:hypothetical protein
MALQHAEPRCKRSLKFRPRHAMEILANCRYSQNERCRIHSLTLAEQGDTIGEGS